MFSINEKVTPITQEHKDYIYKNFPKLKGMENPHVFLINPSCAYDQDNKRYITADMYLQMAFQFNDNGVKSKFSLVDQDVPYQTGENNYFREFRARVFSMGGKKANTKSSLSVRLPAEDLGLLYALLVSPSMRPTVQQVADGSKPLQSKHAYKLEWYNPETVNEGIHKNREQKFKSDSLIMDYSPEKEVLFGAVAKEIGINPGSYIIHGKFIHSAFVSNMLSMAKAKKPLNPEAAIIEVFAKVQKEVKPVETDPIINIIREQDPTPKPTEMSDKVRKEIVAQMWSKVKWDTKKEVFLVEKTGEVLVTVGKFVQSRALKGVFTKALADPEVLEKVLKILNK